MDDTDSVLVLFSMMKHFNMVKTESGIRILQVLIKGPAGDPYGPRVGLCPILYLFCPKSHLFCPKRAQTQVVSPSLGLLGLGPKGPNPTGPEPRQTCGDHP